MAEIESVLRVMLGATLLLVASIAWYYLAQRRMAWWAYCLWGMLALLLPLIGAILVILSRPGTPRSSQS